MSEKKQEVKIKGSFAPPVARMISDSADLVLVLPPDVREHLQQNDMVHYFARRDDSSRSAAHGRGWRELIWRGAEVLIAEHVVMVQPREHTEIRAKQQHERNQRLEDSQWHVAKGNVAAASGGEVIGGFGVDVDATKALDF